MKSVGLKEEDLLDTTKWKIEIQNHPATQNDGKSLRRRRIKQNSPFLSSHVFVNLDKVQTVLLLAPFVDVATIAHAKQTLSDIER